jgi:hypothetical protein
LKFVSEVFTGAVAILVDLLLCEFTVELCVARFVEVLLTALGMGLAGPPELVVHHALEMQVVTTEGGAVR